MIKAEKKIERLIHHEKNKYSYRPYLSIRAQKKPAKKPAYESSNDFTSYYPLPF